MSLLLWIAIGVVAALLAVGLVVALSRRRTARLHRTFGSEYDRTVTATGNRKLAEQELVGRMSRRKQLDIVPLPEDSRRQYIEQWQRVQAEFVDAPAASVRHADVLVSQVMSDRGYPMAEFEQRVADISVDHADVVDNYRAAHAISIASAEQGSAGTEDLRVAITRYRQLFEKLVGAAGVPSHSVAPREPAAERGVGQPSAIE